MDTLGVKISNYKARQIKKQNVLYLILAILALALIGLGGN